MYKMQTEIKIDLLPPSVNTYWRRGRNSTYLSEKGKVFKESVKNALHSQKIKKYENERLKVKIFLFFKGKRKRDIDNHNKAILDSFNGIVWKDDEQIDELITIKSYGNKIDSFSVFICL